MVSQLLRATFWAHQIGFESALLVHFRGPSKSGQKQWRARTEGECGQGLSAISATWSLRWLDLGWTQRTDAILWRHSQCIITALDGPMTVWSSLSNEDCEPAPWWMLFWKGHWVPCCHRCSVWVSHLETVCASTEAFVWSCQAMFNTVDASRMHRGTAAKSKDCSSLVCCESGDNHNWCAHENIWHLNSWSEQLAIIWLSFWFGQHQNLLCGCFCVGFSFYPEKRFATIISPNYNCHPTALSQFYLFLQDLQSQIWFWQNVQFWVFCKDDKYYRHLYHIQF